MGEAHDLYCCACDEQIIPGVDVYWEFPDDHEVMCDGCHNSTNPGGNRVESTGSSDA